MSARYQTHLSLALLAYLLSVSRTFPPVWPSSKLSSKNSSPLPSLSSSSSSPTAAVKALLILLILLLVVESAVEPEVCFLEFVDAPEEQTYISLRSKEYEKIKTWLTTMKY